MLDIEKLRHDLAQIEAELADAPANDPDREVLERTARALRAKLASLENSPGGGLAFKTTAKDLPAYREAEKREAQKTPSFAPGAKQGQSAPTPRPQGERATAPQAQSSAALAEALPPLYVSAANAEPVLTIIWEDGFEDRVTETLCRRKFVERLNDASELVAAKTGRWDKVQASDSFVRAVGYYRGLCQFRGCKRLSADDLKLGALGDRRSRVFNMVVEAAKMEGK